MALELKLSEIKPVPVTFNYEELKKEVAEKTVPYKGLIVEESAIPLAKADLANLRKLEKAIDDRRKAVKKEYNAPYMEFEAKIKDILSDIQEAERNIDTQVKAFEKKAEDEKFAQIERFYNLAFGDLNKDVNFNAIYNAKWLNKTCKMAEIEQEIASAANKLRSDIELIKGMKTSHEVSLLKTLYYTLDLGRVMEEHNALTAIEKRQEAECINVEEKPTQEEKNDSATAQSLTEEFEVDTPKPLQVIAFRVWVTEEQKSALRNFLLTNGIRYGKA